MPDPSPVDPTGTSSNFRRIAPRVVISLVLAGGFAWMLTHGGLPLVPPANAFDTVTTWAVPAYLGVLILSVLLRSLRWNSLLRPIEHIAPMRVLGVGLVGFTAILIAPLRMGELLRPYLIAQRSRLTYEQAIGTVAAERIIDGMILTLLLMVGLQTSTRLDPLPDHIGTLPVPAATIPAAAYSALLLFLSAFAAMVLFYWRRAFAQRVTEATIGVISPRLGKLVSSRVASFADGLRFLPSRSHLVEFLGITGAYWFLNAFATWVLLQGCGLNASFSNALVAMGVLGLGILVPSGPGFFGAFQLSSYCALVLFFPVNQVTQAGSAFVFLCYLLQVSLTLLSGIIGYRLMGPPEPDPIEDASVREALGLSSRV